MPAPASPDHGRGKGYSLIEAVLAGALFALVATIFIGAIAYGNESAALAGQRARAAFIADEGLEIVRNMRDEDFANLVDGTYGLALTGDQWTFSGSQDTVGEFTREITITAVGAGTKTVASTVTWQQNAQRTGTVSLETRMTAWR
ncbi:MAG: hypothetical protein RL272_496 [Candidatus Parcubacteria bacterium]|jgi:Tfp pilus assembly protein PilV